MGDFVMRGFNNLRGTVAERDKLVDIKTTIKLANEDGVITFEEIRESLRKLVVAILPFASAYLMSKSFEHLKVLIYCSIEINFYTLG
jgi:hypothetical protein